MGQLYTIGHSTYPTDHFIELLTRYEVDHVLDVRSTPYSRYVPQYNADVIKMALKKNHIEYHPMGKFFGARQNYRSDWYPQGYLDFALFRQSDVFRCGMGNVIKGLKDYNIALMCTEKDPIDCHRAIMVARGFELEGINVKHILHDSGCITQATLNQRLLERYYPERNQISLFSLNETMTDADYLKEAYIQRNREIGYRPGQGSEGGAA